MSTTTPDTELVITRVFNAPREAVYRAFVDPDQIAQWFGPVGWSVPRDTIDMDVRPGGHQRFTMVNDEDPSKASPVSATFVEVIENELVVAEERWEGVPGMQDGGVMTFRVEFHDQGDGSTRIELRQGPYTAQMREMADMGWGSSFTKLDALLAAA